MKNNHLRQYEDHLVKEKNLLHIAGFDEAGRGPLAGPVVAAAVILPITYNNEKINDSKKLTAKKREALFDEIKDNALAYSIIEIDSKIIDKINILNATKMAMVKALNALDIKPEFLLTDHVPLPVRTPQFNIVKGDSKSISIAAASILAKVYRDRLMNTEHENFPFYNFKKNMGYGTKEHLEALKEHGICDIHRKTFSPIKQMINPQTTLF